MKIKLGVIFGGESVEHEISIITAIQAMNNIDKEKYEIIPIYISKDKTWYTGKMLMELDIYKDFEDLKRYAKKVVLTKTETGFYLIKKDGLFNKKIEELDIVFPIVHGKGVEDGSLAGYLETVGIPYVGPSMLGASLGQDKVVMKQVMESCNIPVPAYTWFYDYEYLSDSKTILKNIKKLGYPVIVKPANLGSSIGIVVAKDENEIENAIEEAINYDKKIVVEKMIDNLVEVNCSVIGNMEYQETSLIDEIVPKHDFLTFNDKYLGNGKKGKLKIPRKTGSKGMTSTDRIIPARISKKIEEEVIKYSKETFKALNLSGIARIDFLVDKKKELVYVNEPNTIPGSLAFYLWKAKGVEYKTLLDDAIKTAIKTYKDNSKKTTTFDSNVLSSYSGGIKGIKGIKK